MVHENVRRGRWGSADALVGYTDGSVQFIEGKSDIIFLATTQNGNNTYWNDTDGDDHPDPPSLWGLLDSFGDD